VRLYEGVFIYRPGKEIVAAAKELTGQEFQNVGAKVLKEDDMGERTLAYEIKKNDRGHYIRYELESNPDSLLPLEKSLKLKPDILKFVFFRKDK
jgi:small subunit ribosomal protein S6